MDLNQITLYSARIEKAVEFYKTLGFILIVDSLPRYARFECPAGNSTFSLHETTEPAENSGVVLYFECEDIDFEYGRLNKLGIGFETAPVDQTWLWREASLYDPDKNKIILYEAGENRKNPPWRLST